MPSNNNFYPNHTANNQQPFLIPPPPTHLENNAEEIPKFLLTLRYVLTTDFFKNIIDWNESGNAFQILDLEAMTTMVLRCYFNHTKYASFHRQLNYFGFKKLSKKLAQHPCTYSHPFFSRDCINDDNVLRIMPRRRHSKKEKPVTAAVIPQSSHPFDILSARLYKEQQSNQAATSSFLPENGILVNDSLTTDIDFLLLSEL